jgi:predicted TIM-barrel fold metal-dependent hydrolase
VSFCPWRQIVQPGQFSLVQDAVRNKGFIGVKLYPVMGFRPMGNDGAADTDYYPQELRAIPHWGQKMDRALSNLYDWCIAEDIPIMAHCSFSQFPSAAAGMRGAPKEWRKVLEQSRWRELRLNVAHLGGVWDLANDPTNGWTADAVTLLADFPNVYGDLADYDPVVEITADQKAVNAKVLPRLKALLDAKPKARDKLMYGSDWVMLSRAVGSASYFAAMRDKMAPAIEADRTAFLGRNAASFLGLDQVRREHNSSQRLEDFLSSRGIPVKFLDRWKQPSVAARTATT